MTPETELAWAAGFFDGEGAATVSTSRNGDGCTGYRYLSLVVAQAEPTTLDRFCAAVGEGRVRGPYQPGRPGKPMWKWSVAGSKAERVSELLWPYLSAPKREQIERVREDVRLRPRQAPRHAVTS